MGTFGAAATGAISYATDSLVVTLGGSRWGDEIARQLLSVTIEDSVLLPAAFELVFRDPFHEVAEHSGLHFGAPVTISLSNGKVLLAGAEVTTRERELDPTGTLTVIRGFDLSHRLHRGRRTEIYRDAVYSDIARKIAGRCGLPAGRIDTPKMAIRPQIAQWNTSDWEFLKSLAVEAGFDVAVVDGKLNFTERTAATGAPSSGDLDTTDPRQITLENVTSFRCVVSGAQQVERVEVRGWDPKTKREVVGTASVAARGTVLADTPAAAARKLGGATLTSVDKLYDQQKDAGAASAALAEEIGGAFGTFEGTISGNPALRAGVPVSLGLAGDAFDGKYTLTATRHTFDEDGYTTWFASTGSSEHSLLGMAATSGPGARIEGVVPAMVTNLRDPEKLGRVKLTFPWLSSTNESVWARVAQPWVGPTYGALFLPEVNDEVLVSFEQGDFARPYVVGSLYNGRDKPAPGATPAVDDSSGTVNVRRMATRKRHAIDLVDKLGAEGIFVRTGDAKNKIELDVAGTRILVSSTGAVAIEGTQTVTVNGGQGVKVTSPAGTIALEAANITVDAKATLKLKGAVATVVEGAIVKIN